jgi:NitT/TauT family transport system permease protein
MSSAVTQSGPSIDPADPSGVEARVAAPRRRNRRWPILVAQLGLIVLILVVWQLASGRLFPDIMISRPSAVFPLLGEWIVDGTFAENAAKTFSVAALGLLIGGLCGVLVGVVLGQSRKLGAVFEPFITALYSMPKFALIPLFIMWVGIGSSLGVLTAAVTAFFLIFFNTFFGIREVRRPLVNSVQIMGGSPIDLMLRVRLPSALVWVVAGLKLAVPQAIVGVVVAEMLAGDEGLGYLVSRNAGMFNSAGTFAALIALLVVTFLVDRVMTWVTRKPLQWKNNGSAM